MSRIVWKQIAQNQWENQEKKRKYDFYITKQRSNNFILDIFNTKIKDNDKAHIASDVFPSLDSAKKEAREFNK